MQPTTPPPFTRKIIVINRRFQYRFALLLMIPVMLIQAFFWIAVYFFFTKMSAFGQAYQLPHTHIFYKVLATQKREIITALPLLTSFFGASLFIWGLYISHRIAGPMFKFEKYMREATNINDLKTKPLYFRKKDFFHNIPEVFNDLIKRS